MNLIDRFFETLILGNVEHKRIDNPDGTVEVEHPFGENKSFRIQITESLVRDMYIFEDDIESNPKEE